MNLNMINDGNCDCLELRVFKKLSGKMDNL